MDTTTGMSAPPMGMMSVTPSVNETRMMSKQPKAALRRRK